MAVYNVLVKLLDGKTATLHYTTPTITGETLKRHLYTLTQIPPHHQRLITGTHQITSSTILRTPSLPTVHLLLRLAGGKGGFGSLLRGAATKAGQKKTNNFDACRDMSGRRLRYVNAEKKLEEWKADEEERKLEKIAEEFIKKKVKEVKKSGSGESQKYVAKYREDSRKCMDVVDASVRESFKMYAENKRKMMPSAGSKSKRMKLWNKEKEDESDSDDEDDDEKLVVLDEVNVVLINKDCEGSSSGVNSDGESSGAGSMQSNLEEENGDAKEESIEVREGYGSGGAHVEEANLKGLVEPEGVMDVPMVSEKGVVPSEVSAPLDVEAGTSKESNGQSTSNSSLEVAEASVSGDAVAEVDDSVQEAAAVSPTSFDQEKPFDLNDYNSASEMEVLGMERLKAELFARGLKCGGTLQERAARLFLLKTTPLEKLSKKLKMIPPFFSFYGLMLSKQAVDL